MSNKNLHNIKVGSDIERTDNRINQTGEVFTPMELCKKMVNELPENTWAKVLQACSNSSSWNKTIGQSYK